MPITLSTAYLAEIARRINTPNVIMEVTLDSGVVKWGYADGGFIDVVPIIKTVSSSQAKLDTESGWTTRGEITFVIAGRENFKSLIANNYLMNRRVVKKEGFLATGFLYTDYAAVFSGKITDWSRSGDELTLTVSDDLFDTTINIPAENADKTQYIDYTHINPLNAMQNILDTQLGISTAYIDLDKFASERDTWRNGWTYNRVITEPKAAIDYLNELQEETHSYIYHDGAKISLKVFAPSLPSEAVEEWSDNIILMDSISQTSGYKDNFFNRIVIYYDYDESGSDNADNYDSAVIVIDATSQGAAQWNDVSSKTIKSKWIRTYRHNMPATIAGCVVYHASKNNGAGNGTLTFTYDATNGNTIQWTPPGGSGIGEAIKITENGKFSVYGLDTTKYVDVIITTASLPTSNATATLTFTAINGAIYAGYLAQSYLSKYRNPATTFTFDIDLNNVVYNSKYMTVTDYKDITSDEFSEKGVLGWNQERIMLTSIKPDIEAGKITIEGIETGFYYQYGIIAPAGYPDWDSASDAQKAYGYIGHCNIL